MSSGFPWQIYPENLIAGEYGFDVEYASDEVSRAADAASALEVFEGVYEEKEAYVALPLLDFCEEFFFGRPFLGFAVREEHDEKQACGDEFGVYDRDVRAGELRFGADRRAVRAAEFGRDVDGDDGGFFGE